MGVFPKHAVISSHDLRRSFATNFFGKIPTPVLMQMTGHAKESTFMTYIGRDPNRDSYADTFMEGILTLKKTPRAYSLYEEVSLKQNRTSV